MTIKSLLIVVASLPLVGNAAVQPDRSHCAESEKVVFSCAVSNKVVSLCATPNLTANSGRLTYRFGPLGQSPELAYPAGAQSPSKAFAANFDSWAKGSYAAVSFSRGDFIYTVYNRRAAFEEDERSNGGGVRVEHNGEQVKDLSCKTSSIQDHIWEMLHEIKLPTKP